MRKKIKCLLLTFFFKSKDVPFLIKILLTRKVNNIAVKRRMDVMEISTYFKVPSPKSPYIKFGF
jgi:hypothetical protein